MSAFAEDALSRDAFLGGRLRIWQPKAGYRAGVDPVLLAAAIHARPGQSVLELGCGAGTAALCLHARVPELELSGVEVQPAYAELARRNSADCGAGMAVWAADLARLPADLRQHRFEHVIANPPYYPAGSRTVAADKGREGGLGEVTPLAMWVEVAARRCLPRGHVTMIQRADRLADLLAAMQARLGSIRVLPIAPRTGRDAALVIVQARAQGRSALRLHAPLVLHDGAAHDGDRESYTPQVRAVLRDAAALCWPD